MPLLFGNMLSENALKVLEKRYLRKDKNGKVIETPEEMFRRVAHDIAEADKKYGEDAKKLRRSFMKLCPLSYFSQILLLS